MLCLLNMQEIRLARRATNQHWETQRRVLGGEWLPATMENRQRLKSMLDEALAAHGTGSHWIESRTV